MPSTPSASPGDGPILFFDGECGLCARSVRFVLEHERDRDLRFAALQSPLGRDVAARAGLDPDEPTTLVHLDEEGGVTTRSNAAMEVARHLRLPWRLVRLFRIVPRGLRDLAYRFVAKRRLRWFGTADGCALVSREDAARLIEGSSASVAGN